MQERLFVTLGFLPLLAGVAGLLLLRRPEASVVRSPTVKTLVAVAGNSPPPAAAGKSNLGVIIAGHTADLGAEIGGSVVRVFVREGARVREGDPLVYIDPAAANSEARMAEAELAQQMSAVTRAQADHDQASDLLARLIAVGSGIPDQTIVAARSREASARAALEEARAGIDVGKARIHREQSRIRKHLITAPFTGVVVMLGVDPGDVVLGGQVVARVISEDHDVRFAVPASERELARAGARVTVTVPGTSVTAQGVVTDVMPEVDAASGMVFVRARLELDAARDNAVVAGTSVQVSLSVSEAKAPSEPAPSPRPL